MLVLVCVSCVCVACVSLRVRAIMIESESEGLCSSIQVPFMRFVTFGLPARLMSCYFGRR